ncbi:MAG: hypothetical protein ACIAQZ_00990 [Sedimentisphaeraceae bacterium JB056]
MKRIVFISLLSILLCSIAYCRNISLVMGSQSEGFDPWNTVRWADWYDQEGTLIEPFEIDVSVTFESKTTPWSIDMSSMPSYPASYPALLVLKDNQSITVDGNGVVIDARNSYVSEWTLYYLYTHTIDISNDYVNADGILLYQTETAEESDSGSFISNMTLKGFQRAIAANHFHHRKVTFNNMTLERNIWGLFPRGGNVTFTGGVIKENVLGGLYGEYNSYNWVFTGNVFQDNNNRGTSSYGDVVLDACRDYTISDNDFLGASYSTRNYRTAVSLYRNAGEETDIREYAAKDNIIDSNRFENYNIAIDFAPRMGLINTIEQSGEARCYTSGNVVRGCSFNDCVIGVLLRGSGAVLENNSFALKTPSYCYEPFDYTVGSLVGSDGGTGWAGSWEFTYTNGSQEVVEQGLSFSDISVSGGALKLTEDNIAGSFRSAGVRRLVDFEPPQGSDLWISFLAKSAEPLSSFVSRTAEIRHGATAGSTKLRMRPKGSGSQGAMIAYDSTGSNSAAKNLQDGNTYLYICRFGDVDSAEGKYAVMWVFDEAGFEVAVSDGSLTEDDLNDNYYLMAQDAHADATVNMNDGVLINIGDSSTDQFSYYFDELRYGSSLDDVIDTVSVVRPVVMHNVFYSMYDNYIDQPGDDVWLWSVSDDYSSFLQYFAYSNSVGSGISAADKFYHVVSGGQYPEFKNADDVQLLVAPSLIVPKACDIDSDIDVDIYDISQVLAQWLTEGFGTEYSYQNTNVDLAGNVDIKDWAICADDFAGEPLKLDTYPDQIKPIAVAAGDMAVYEDGDEIAVIWDQPVSQVNDTMYYSIIIYDQNGFELDRCGRSENKWAMIATGNFLPDTGYIKVNESYEIAAVKAEADTDGKYPVYIFRKGFKEPAVILYEDNSSPITAIASGNFNTASDDYEEIAVKTAGSTNITYLKPSLLSWSASTLNVAGSIVSMTAGEFDGLESNGDEIAAVTGAVGAVLFYTVGGSSHYATAADNSVAWDLVKGGNFDGGLRAREEIAVIASEPVNDNYTVEYYVSQSNTPFKSSVLPVTDTKPQCIDSGKVSIGESLTIYDSLVNIDQEDFLLDKDQWGDYLLVLPFDKQTFSIPAFWIITDPDDSNSSYYKTVPILR